MQKPDQKPVLPPVHAAASALSRDSEFGDHTRRKIFWRIIPCLFILYIIAFIDRANVAFAKMPMSEDLKFSEAVFGFGAGVFFLGYILLEIPGALIVERWSARFWIACIMITWGICTALVGFVHTANQFYLARFFLGVAQAGFFPGIIVYLTHWIVKEDRAKAVAGFTLATPAAMVIGAPLAALIMKYNWLDMAGWRWIFILEGIPAVVFGVATLYLLTDRPKHANWLKGNERDWITARLEEEKQTRRGTGHLTVMQGLRQPNVLCLGLACAFANLSMGAYMLWLPQTIKNASGLSTTTSTVLSSLPFALAMFSIPLVARSSDRTGRRKLHTIVPLVLASGFFLLSAIPGLPFPVVMTLLCLTGAAAFSWGVSFWVIPSLILGESAGAASVGFINIINAAGSFAGPFVTGHLLTNGYTHRDTVYLLSTCFLVSAALVATIRPKSGTVL